LLACEFLRFGVYTVLLSKILKYHIGDLLLGFVPVLISAAFVGVCIGIVRFYLPLQILNLPLVALGIEGLAGGLGLFLGLMGPWSRKLRRDIYDRFLVKSSLKEQRLIQVFVNL
jgi:hypothetical protein